MKSLSYISYPGSKAEWYFSTKEQIINLKPKLIVDLFCGGGSWGFYCASLGKQVIMNDKDTDLINFHKRILFGETDFIEEHKKFRDEYKKLSLKEREKFHKKTRIKAKKNNHLSHDELFYLNNVNFSKIIPTTGMFSRYGENLYLTNDFYDKWIRMKEVKKYKDNITLLNKDYKEVISEYDDKDTLFLIDPPYYEKAHRLYRHYFSKDQHCELRDILSNIKGKFYITYAYHPEIEKLYKDFNIYDFKNKKSISQMAELKYKEIIITNYDLFLQRDLLGGFI